MWGQESVAPAVETEVDYEELANKLETKSPLEIMDQVLRQFRSVRNATLAHGHHFASSLLTTRFAPPPWFQIPRPRYWAQFWCVVKQCMRAKGRLQRAVAVTFPISGPVMVTQHAGQKIQGPS